MSQFLTNLAARLFAPALHNVQYFERRRILLSAVAIVAFPLYYVVWHDIFPQPYENLWLRLLGSAMFVPILFAARWPGALERFRPHYWYFSILFALPFFFTFMMLKNNGSNVWVESALIAVFAMVLLLDWLTLVIHFVVGTGLAWLAYLLTTEAPHLTLGHLDALPILAFAVVLGAASNYATEMVRTEQERAMLATAASIAHELRTPLLGIKAGAAGVRNYLPHLLHAYQLAKEYHLAVQPIRAVHLDTMKHVLDRIESEANYSNSIIDMLLTSVRPTDQVALAEFRIGECIESALERYPFSDNERSLVTWQRGNDFTMRGAELLMVHVLFNLIKNALRHIAKAGKGAIAIRTECFPDHNRLVFRDTGSGIPREVLPHVFTRFYTAAGNGDALLGTGIGLAFCRDVMQACGGTIDCRSEAGEFTEFILTFPKP